MHNAQLELEPLQELSVLDISAAPDRRSRLVQLTAEETRAKAFLQFSCLPSPRWKRCIDIAVSLMLLAVLSPFLALVTVWVRIASGEPALFKQKRMGLSGRDFTILKFRTLRHCPLATAEHREFIARRAGTGQAIDKPDLKDRLIPGGALLRATSMDELPQLINILRGEMSLIGPRPDVLKYCDYQPHQLERFSVLPGVTGLWQVSGKNKLTFEQMIEKDIDYVRRRSFWLDMQIAFRTILVIAKRENL